MHWSIQDKMAIVFSAVVLIIVLLSLATYRNAYHLIDANRLVIHTHEVQEDLESILSLLKDAETGQRGFLLTGNEQYLEPYLTSTASLDQRLQHVERLVVDNSSQIEKIRVLKPLVVRKLQELDQTIRLRRAEGFAAAQEVVRSGSGKETMDRIRQVIASMRSTEADLLRTQIDRVALENSATTFTIIVATLLNLLLLALGYYTITKHLRERREYEATITQLSTRLHLHADQTGSGDAGSSPT
jgi:CHASE3 domain sensor protein